MSTKRILLTRSVYTVFLLLAILSFLFFLFRLAPGDYTTVMMFQGASQEAVEKFKEAWGLNDPLHIQYLRYMGNFITGDVGTSVQHRMPVWDYVKVRIFNSALLVAPAITTAYVFGAIYGTLLGRNRGMKFEEYGIVPVVLIGAFPSFFVALILVAVFSSWLGWFPSSGLTSFEVRSQLSGAVWWEVYFTKSFIWHYCLPFCAIVLRYSISPTLVMRTSVVEVLGQNFVYYNRMIGLKKNERFKRLAKHASLPIITLYPISLAQALGGLVLIEMVFNWPGIGYALVTAVFNRDYPVIQFVFFLMAAFVIVSNFVIDVLYTIIDPRVKLGDES